MVSILRRPVSGGSTFVAIPAVGVFRGRASPRREALIMTATDSSKGAGQDDDLPDVVEIVRAMGLAGMSEDTKTPSPPLPSPPLPCRRPHLMRIMVRACRRISRSSPIELGTMSKRQAPPTPAAPMPPTGSIFAPGAVASRSIRCLQTRRSSVSISPRRLQALEGPKKRWRRSNAVFLP